VLPGIIGSIQALETIKWIIGAGDSLVGRLLLFDALKLRFRELKLRKDPDCPICGTNPSIHELIDYQAFCGIGAVPDYSGLEISVEDFKREREAKGDGLMLLDVREPHEWVIAHIEGARLIPLGQLPDRLSELDGHAEIVTQCHRGSRSMKALEILRGAGFGKVRNLAGGIDAWAERIEPGMARY
jgi:adenylyltransferase/sulfurtransferase